jgi:hypothetical protein
MFYSNEMKKSITSLALLLSALAVPAATFDVTSKLESGPGTLRQALLNAAASPGIDRIEFHIPLVSGSTEPALINITGASMVANDVVIDGRTQPVALGGTAPGLQVALRAESNSGGGPTQGQLQIGSNVLIQGVAFERGYSFARAEPIIEISGASNVIQSSSLRSSSPPPLGRTALLSIKAGASAITIGGTGANKNSFIAQDEEAISGSGAAAILVKNNIFEDVSHNSSYSALLIMSSCQGCTIEDNSFAIKGRGAVDVSAFQNGVVIRRNIVVCASQERAGLFGIKVDTTSSSGLLDILGNHLYGILGKHIDLLAPSTAAAAVTSRIHGNFIGTTSTTPPPPSLPSLGCPATLSLFQRVLS